MGKSKPNGFIIFAKEYKKKEGLRFNSFSELLNACGPYWESLPESEKNLYKEKAKCNYNIGTNRKRDSQNIFSGEIEQKKPKLVNEEEEKNLKVKDIVYTANDLGILYDKVFYFLHISTYIEYYPAELAIAKYSLRNGIIDTIHIKINPGKLPNGTSFMAQEKANRTHKYSLPSNHEEDDDSIGETSYILILMKIIDFITNPDDELPMFFTEGSTLNDYSELQSVQRSLIQIFEGAGEYQIAAGLKVYSIIDLFYYLNNVSDICNDDSADVQINKFASYVSADEEFRNAETVYRYGSIGCSYHEELDNLRYCCLSKVLCYGFIVSKFCVNPTNCPLIEGRHYPKGYNIVTV